MASNKKQKNTNKKVDARIERSRALIIEAFERLVISQPFEKLTVSAIAREAQVDRKTFYQHFGSIEGVMRAIGDDTVMGIVDEVETKLAQHKVDPDDSEALTRAFFAAVNESLSSNILVNIALFEAVPNEVLISHLRAPLERELFTRNLVTVDVPEETLGYYFAFVLGGILAAYRNWMKSGGDPFKLDEVADIATNLAMNGVANVIKINAPAE